MPPPDLALRPADLRGAAPRRATLRGWGGGAGSTGWVLRPDRAEQVGVALELFRARAGGPDAWSGMIARGMGRSYGDAAQLERGLVIETAGLKGFELDPRARSRHRRRRRDDRRAARAARAGGMDGPGRPGTQHVSVGGAIASDIHGKNHGTAGTFGSHVEALATADSCDGEVIDVAPGADGGLFEATLGGMGLTGVILSARIRCGAGEQPVPVGRHRPRPRPRRCAVRARGNRGVRIALLGSTCSARGPGAGSSPARSTWPAADAPARGARRADDEGESGGAGAWPQGVLSRQHRPRLQRASLPPSACGRARAARGDRQRTCSRSTHSTRGRGCTGRRGLRPVPAGRPVRSRARARRSDRRAAPRPGAVLPRVLKDFGAANGAPLSFPLAGWTLALDLPRERARPRAGARPLRRARRAGRRPRVPDQGRAHATRRRCEAMYPRLEEWRAVRDRADPERLWRSDLALRTGLVRPDTSRSAGPRNRAPR